MASQIKSKQAPARKRVIHQLDTPLSTVAWPSISSEDQDGIIELLCSLLTPIGNHRENHIKKSKGRKARSKAKRETKTTDSQPANDTPPEPSITKHVDVGFNTITSNLSSISSSETSSKPPRKYAAVFVAQGDQSPAFNHHFPQMIGMASKDFPDDRKVRLVGLPKGCSERLSHALGLPRVSSVALVEDAPGAKALEELVRRVVPVVDVSWLEGPGTMFKRTKIDAVETTVGVKKVRVS